MFSTVEGSLTDAASKIKPHAMPTTKAIIIGESKPLSETFSFSGLSIATPTVNIYT